MENGTKELWWKFANDYHLTDNFALRVLAGEGCCNGSNTDRRHLETAKRLVRRFTFVLDVACLDASMDTMAQILNITARHKRSLVEKFSRKTKKKQHDHRPPIERIPYPEVYEYLLDRYVVSAILWTRTRSTPIS